MIKHSISLILITMFLFSMAAFGSGDHDSNNDKKTEKIILSQEAKKNFRIKTEKFKIINGQLEVPNSAIVTSQDKKQVFVLHNEKYESKDVYVVLKNMNSQVIRGVSGTEIEVVVSGVNYLKVVEMSHNEEGGGGHGH